MSKEISVGDWIRVLDAKDADESELWGMRGKYLKVSDINYKGPDGENILVKKKINGSEPIYFHLSEVELVSDSDVSVEMRSKDLFGPSIAVWMIFLPGFPLVPDSYLCHFLDCNMLAARETLFNVHGTVIVAHGCPDCFKNNNGILCDGRQLKTPLPGLSGDGCNFVRIIGEDMKRLGR